MLFAVLIFEVVFSRSGFALGPPVSLLRGLLALDTWFARLACGVLIFCGESVEPLWDPFFPDKLAELTPCL